MHGRIATYTYTGDANDIAQKVEDGMLPILKAQPGFKSYSIMSAGEKIISISAWDSADAAEAANAAIADWVAENIAEEVELKKSHIGEVIVSTTFGITAKDRVTA
jgi:hypothetical protein